MIIDMVVETFGPGMLMICASGGILVAMVVFAVALREHADAQRRKREWERRWR